MECEGLGKDKGIGKFSDQVCVSTSVDQARVKEDINLGGRKEKLKNKEDINQDFWIFFLVKVYIS